jgi:cytochrome oxidase Cu insertion factor (SCO1/SenC/PrrC family)
MRIHFSNIHWISLPIIIIAAIVIMGISSCAANPQQSVRSADPNLSQSKPAPDFTTTDIDGKSIRLSDFQGKKFVVLVFNRSIT